MWTFSTFRQLACLSLFLLTIALVPLHAEAKSPDGIADEVAQQLGLPTGFKPEYLLVATSKDEKYTEEEAKVNAPDILSLEACHVGGQRILIKVTFARPSLFANATLIVYIDMDNDPKTGRTDQYHRGVDVMLVVTGTQVSLNYMNPLYSSSNTFVPGAARVGNALYLTLEAPFAAKDGKLPLGLHLLSERGRGRSDSTSHKVVELPFHPDRAVPKVTRQLTLDLRPLTDYRFHNDLVKLEKLKDKGISGDMVRPAKPFVPGRTRPLPTFAATGRQPGKVGAVKRQEVGVELLEEAGVARRATPLTFGFPLPRGAVFDLSNLRILSATGAAVPAQFTATCFWPDNSLKWVLIDFTTPLGAQEKSKYIVQLGSEVKPSQMSGPVKVSESNASISIITGPLKAVIDKQRFNLLHDVWYDANRDGQFVATERVAASGAEGIRLVNERGKTFSCSGQPPDSVRIEEQGPQKVVVRVEGAYAAADGETYMRYVVRLTFRAGLPRVTLALTHLNDYLKTEFTDITSLSMPFASGKPLQQMSVYLPGDKKALEANTGRRVSLFQSDERKCQLRVEDRKVTGGQAPGVFRCTMAGGVITGAVHDYWQRWPKGISADDNGFSVDLLPVQPGTEYGTDLPHYLMFPLVEGKYRFKWGMSFTEQVTLDFSPETKAQELVAEANLPVLAVVPASWYAETGALGPLAAPIGKQFAQWDKVVADAYRIHKQRQNQNREYGYFNYGDWYGERGRNWGNNEYDRAHGFFMQFARTGNRDYFRLALAAARHQADVDCIHAYPDPFYLGGNHLHSVGHTGAWTEQTSHGVWSCRYDSMSTAANGHTWADGMMDGWYLAGEARVMEAAIGLGEHIAWAMSPTFQALGENERSAGWSLKSIMAIYRGTSDPVYLEAAKRIAAVALREQKFDEGGAWPHALGFGHSGDHPGARGNNLLMIGVLLGGLKEYHEATQDPAVQKSLVAGAEWVLKSWDENAEGWPYSASTTGEPFYKPSTSLNTLIIEPLAYVGHLSGKERFIQVAETGLSAVARGELDAFGKSIAMQMHFTSGTMALLQQWYAKHRPDKGVAVIDGSEASMQKYLAKSSDADRQAVRAPDEKVFFVRLRGPSSELVATRSPYGAMQKRAEFGTIKVSNAAGVVAEEGKFSTDSKHEFRCTLKGEAGADFKVVVQDDQRGVWTLKGDNLRIVVQTVPGFRIGGVGRGRYHFFVPQGTKEFRTKLVGVHPGTYGAAVMTPGNQVLSYHQDTNPGQALITVHPEAGDTGRMWSLILWAAGDIGCELEGIPPYLSITRDSWFEPGK